MTQVYSILTRMDFGVAGDITRQSQTTIEPQVPNASLPFTGYGLPGKIASNKFVPFAGGEAATDLYGILVRPYPITGANASDPVGTSVPSTLFPCNVLKRGYISVKVNAGTPAVNGPVYVRVATPGTGKPIGGFEAASDTTNTVLIPNAVFTGAADASGNAEIAYNI